MGESESAEKICEQIREDGEREIASILEKARSTAEEIIGKAEAKRDEAAGKIMREAREKGEAESRRLLSSVNIEVRRAKHRHRVWKRHADRNKDGVVDRKERAIDALKRQRRRGSP